MTRDTLFVEAHQGQWQIRTDEEQGDADWPRYEKREAAVDAAILSAQNSSKRGRSGAVYVSDGDGTFRLECLIPPKE